MCLGIPGRLISLLDGYNGQLALVDVEGVERKVNIGMLEDQDLVPGEWVVIHMGFAVERVDEAGAAEALAGLELVGRPRDRRCRRRFEVSGLVQGVGFRPFVYVAATDLGLSGSVANDSGGVIVEVEGPPSAVDELGRRLRAEAPALALVESVVETELGPTGVGGFVIDQSQRSEGRRTLASPDVATCEDCLRELADPADRRFRHPFINCTNCGPRFTVITGLPYDRQKTTMADFSMCEQCRAEYEEPTDRRFHAQPIACPDCGPRLEFVDDAGSIAGDADALAMARYRLGAGAIIAVKGIGGYHLVCDAENEDAVRELRRRKQRGGKPFAIMVRDAASAQGIVAMTDTESALLRDARRPIVLLSRRPDPQYAIARAVAPDTDDLGVMLPYSPLHTLLFGLSGDGPGPRALVMTSGNRGGEPIVADDDAAIDRLGALVDAWLRHNRRIHVPCDDSVARIVDGTEAPIRRSRGYAPLPVALPFDVPPTLAVGADLKNTFAIAVGRHAWLSQHIGDMDDLATIDAFAAAEKHLELLTGVRPEVIACDAHPGYRSTHWARDRSRSRPVVAVQHHHAHIASVMGEHGLDGSSPVIGIAFDGTGYGADQCVWGGEVLIADYKGFRRFARLAYVPMAGADAAVMRPYRMALAHLSAAAVDWGDDLPPVAACSDEELGVLRHQLATGLGCVDTSSIGRLFDAVASLVGVRQVCDYEAEAAMALEAIADRERGAGRYIFGVERATDDGMLILDPRPVVAAVARDVRRGVEASRIASQFHSAVSDLVVACATAARDEAAGTALDLSVVALGGGVFQNARLLAEATEGLRAEGFVVLSARRAPTNDGGIALGQILIASSG